MRGVYKINRSVLLDALYTVHCFFLASIVLTRVVVNSASITSWGEKGKLSELNGGEVTTSTNQLFTLQAVKARSDTMLKRNQNGRPTFLTATSDLNSPTLVPWKILLYDKQKLNKNASL